MVECKENKIKNKQEVLNRKNKIEALKQSLIAKYPKLYREGMCLARAHNRETKWKLDPDKHRCRRRTLIGRTRCRVHGGAYNIGRPITSGIKSKYYTFRSNKLQDSYNRFLKDPEMGQVDREIAIIRALIDNLLKMEQQKDVLRYSVALGQILDQAGKMVDRYHRIAGNYFNMHALPIVINNIVAIADRSLTKCPKCNFSLEKLKEGLFNRLSSFSLPEPSCKDGEPKYGDATLPDGSVIMGNVDGFYQRAKARAKEDKVKNVKK